MKVAFLLPLALVFLVSAVGQPVHAGAEGVGLWGRFDRAFAAVVAVPEATAFRVAFTAPSGRMHTVDGFWEGERNWRVRFMPDEPGTWRYRTAAPPATGLDGQTGRFECAGRMASLASFGEHGPLRVSHDRHSLAHRDGRPFFWMGDTVWNGPLLASQPDWDLFLEKRRAQKYTAIQFVMTNFRAAYHDEIGQVAFTGREKISINPRFFQRLDQRIAAINDHGLLAVPVLLWAIRGEENPGWVLPEAEAIRLARYLVARYQAHHVAWILPGDGNYAGENGERWKRIGRAVFGDGPHAPTLLHPGGMQWPYDAFRDEAWLDMLGYQSGHGDDAGTWQWVHSGPPSRAWKTPPVRPILNLEPPYEDHVAYQSRKPHPALNVRRAVYWSLLCAPPAGVTYGAHGVWSWEIKPNVPLNHTGTGIARPWFEAVDFPGGVQMGRVVELFTSLPWNRLRPAPEIVEQPAPDDPLRFVGAARTEDGSVAVVYCPAGPRVTVRQPGKGEWFDPRTGERRPAIREGDAFRLPDGKTDEQDWVLVVRRA